MRKVHALSLAVCVALLAAVSARAEWSAGKAIPGFIGSFAVYKPRIAVAADQSLAVTWAESGGLVWMSSRAGASGAWSTFQLNSGASGDDPRVAMNAAGDAAVVWLGNNRASVRYRPVGEAWKSASLLELGNPNVDSGSRVAINSAGDVLVAWIGLDNGATQCEIHTAFRSKSGSWPSTGSFQVPGAGPNAVANLSGELDVALDDAGNGVVAWTTFYATIHGNTDFPVSVVRASRRSPGGSWSTRTDLSSRGPNGDIPCDATLPVVPDAHWPQLAVDPKTGDLAVAYVYDPTGIERIEINGVPTCSPTPADTSALSAAGTTASPPVGGTSYGTWVGVAPPSLAFAGGTVALAWNRCLKDDILSCELRLQASLAPFGQPLSLAVDQIVNPVSSGVPAQKAVGASQQSRGFFVHAQSSVAYGWEMVAGAPADPPTVLRTGISGFSNVDVAAKASGYAVAPITGSDRKIYIAENLIFGDGFETGDTNGWSHTSP